MEEQSTQQKTRITAAERYATVNGVPHRICSTCREYFPMTNQYFSVRSASPDGLAYSCKECERVTSRKSYLRRKGQPTTTPIVRSNPTPGNTPGKTEKEVDLADKLMQNQTLLGTTVCPVCNGRIDKFDPTSWVVNDEGSAVVHIGCNL